MPKTMIDCFVIMPIGHSETDEIWDVVYQPTIAKCGCKPIRIDKEDNGGLLPMQIINRLQTCPLLIADLTFGRPNCYFEVGYAMGLNKTQQMILCCREDHNHDSPKFNAKLNKIHFDLQSYGILFWERNRLEAFKRALAEKLKQRKKTLGKVQPFGESEDKKLDERLKRVTAQERNALKWIKRN